MLTAEQYVGSLDDGRRLFLHGREITRVADDPRLAQAARSVAEGYARHWSPAQDAHHPMYDAPRSVDDLRRRAELLRSSDFTASTSAAVLALLTVAPEFGAVRAAYEARMAAYVRHCRQADIRVAECITDAKGDRSTRPGDQDDPDLYLRVVDRTTDGIVVRGAKFHVTAASLVHELVVMPTKRMRGGEEDYAVAFGTPVNAPGIYMINSSYAPAGEDTRHYPFSRQYALPEAVVVFDDVFVPNDRVFLDGDLDLSDRIVHSLGLWERLSGVIEMEETANMLAGMAELIAEANGLARASHIRDKIAEIAVYATMLRSGLDAAIYNSSPNSVGMLSPGELHTNSAIYYGASHYHLMVRHLQDIAGGSIVTAPTMSDAEHEKIGPFVKKYLRTMPGVDAEYRLQLFHLIRDFTADALGGWRMVGHLQGGGGLRAERLVALKHFDVQHARETVLSLLGRSEGTGGQKPGEAATSSGANRVDAS